MCQLLGADAYLWAASRATLARRATAALWFFTHLYPEDGGFYSSCVRHSAMLRSGPLGTVAGRLACVQSSGCDACLIIAAPFVTALLCAGSTARLRRTRLL